MKKQKLTITTITFLMFGLIFLTLNSKAQMTVINAGSANVSGTTTATDLDIWEEVGAVELDVNNGDKVLVLSTFEANVALSSYDLLCGYRVTDGIEYSPVIKRYVAAKNYEDHGLAAIGYTFTYSGTSGLNNFTLQHAKIEIANGKQRQFTTKGVLVAMVINDADVDLPSSHRETGEVTTTSTVYEKVPGTKTDTITLTKKGGIYLTTSFSTFGNGILTGSYVLRSSPDGADGNFTPIDNAEINRTNSINPGAATISILLENQPAGDYYFDVAHKTSTGTLTTVNLSLDVVGLVTSDSLIFQTFSNMGGDTTNITSNFEPVNSETIASPTNGHKIFMHSTFNMSSTGPLLSEFQLTAIEDPTFTPQILHRYLPEAGSTGSAGLIGLAIDLPSFTDYNIKLEHKSIVGTTLTTYNSNLVGFQLCTSPTSEFTGETDNNWYNSSNWTPNEIPADTNYVSIPSGQNPIIDVTTAANCYDLDVAGSLTINSDGTSTGSLIASSSTITGTVNVERYLPSSNWHIVSSPVGGQDWKGFADSTYNSIATSINNPYYGLAPYEEATDSWAYFRTDAVSGTPFETAKGYVAKRSIAGTVTFTGTSINVGEQSVNITKSNFGWNAVGNPYTSAIIAKGTNSFLADANNISAIDPSYLGLYIWDQSVPDYTVIHPGTGEFQGRPELDQTNIAVGQGFIVKANTASELITFNKEMQVHETTTPFKSAEKSIPAVRLTVTSGDFANNTIVSFEQESTKGLDPGYDVGKLKGNANIALFTQLVDGSSDVDFMYQSLPDINYELLTIPVGLDLKNAGDITFSLETSEGFPADMKVYLEDKALNVTTQLDSEDAIYSASAPTLKGYGRFSLHFTNSTTGIDTDKLNTTNFNAFTRDRLIFINGQADKNTRLSIYGIDGKMWHQNRAEATNQNIIDASGFAAGVYLIKIDKQSGSQTLKIVLSN